MRRFIVTQAAKAGALIEIRGADARHLKQVLRLKPGDLIEVADGTGLVFEARLQAFHNKNAVAARLERRLNPAVEPPVEITLAQALLKDRKMDSLIRQLTELGLARWIPFTAQRSVPRPDSRRLENRTQRWHKIAREALKQCRRIQLPEIVYLPSLESVLNFSRSFNCKLLFWEKATTPLEVLSTPEGSAPAAVFLLLGPEGGFEAGEVRMAQQAGFQAVSLGPRILRAETAALTACVLAQYLYGDLGPKKS